MKQKGTISEVPTREFESKELTELWEKFNSTLHEIEDPTNRYTRNLSDLIRRLGDEAEQLILRQAIPGLQQQDTASYVRKQLIDRGVPLNNHFYEYFKPEQKREWQTQEFVEKKKVTNHQHEWILVKNVEGVGEIKRCTGTTDALCTAKMIDGIIYEATEQEDSEPELKPQKPKSNFEQKHEFIIDPLRDAGRRLLAVADYWRTHDSDLTPEEQKTMQEEIYLLQKAGETVDLAYDDKTKMPPIVQHFLVSAYAAETQNYAGGKYIMLCKDWGAKRHGMSIKTIKDIGDFSKLITSKQTRKVMAGLVSDLHPRYAPNNQKEAQDMGFSGDKCNHCGSMRVGYDRILNTDWSEGDPVHEKFNITLVCFQCGQQPKRTLNELPKAKNISVDWQSQ